MLRVPCDPQALDLQRLAARGGTVVVPRWSPPPGARLRRGDPVDLTDGRVVVLATVVRRRSWRGRWSFRVRPMQDPSTPADDRDAG